MHTIIAAAADWQFEESLSEANCKRVRKYRIGVRLICLTDNRHRKAIKCHSIFCPFVGPPFCGGPCSAEHAEHA